MHTQGEWIQQGQWATRKGTAECVEAKGFGIIGAWIDISNEPEENMALILAAPKMQKALKSIVNALQEEGATYLHGIGHAYEECMEALKASTI